AMNSLCAAGTGSFLDQQAKRIGVSIEKEFGELALRSENPPRMAGRCSVFAKSDMIHLQQIATPVHDIVAGLCFAMVRNLKSNLARGKQVEIPVSFQGGVAANRGVIRAFREVFDLNDGELIIPEYHASMGAIGAIFHILDQEPAKEIFFRGTQLLGDYLKSRQKNTKQLEPLKETTANYQKEVTLKIDNDEKIPVYLGLDVGSLSTNLVLIDNDNNVVARRYLPTASKPLEAIRKGLDEIYREVGDLVEVKAAGTTGSGRYLTGDFVGADVIRNEITTQATAAIAIDPQVDTIFEIGGQDSKYISIQNGIVVDFEMNKVCAAGTGSFLEEQAEKLNIDINEDFANLAFKARGPANLGDRCTVFIESDLNAHQQKGVSKENLVSGLAYSIVFNYLQKVVGNKRVGDRIFFQGGVTNNKAVVAAFEKVTGKKIIVPPHFDITGAIGAAMLSREAVKNGKETRFKGFDISKVPYSLDRFTCNGCSNQCEIRRVKIGEEQKPLFYGGRCEKYEKDDRKGRGEGIPNLFKERYELLINGFEESRSDGKPTIGIPRTLMIFYQQFPFWRTFFEELGFHVILSDPTDQKIIRESFELLVAETCFPVELMHGHILNLLEKEVDHIFIPFVVNAKAEEDNPTSNCNCPWIQSYPFMIRGALKDEKDKEKLLIPTLHFRYFGRVLNNELSSFFGEKFGISRSRIVRAVADADKVQEDFERSVEHRGREVLASLPEDKEAVVILGRPYNTGDPELNLHVADKLINQDVLPIPLDYLPLKEENIFHDYSMIYWPSGQKILEGSRIIKRNDKLHAIHISNFRCGPDSFITHFLAEEMKGKPYLHLEIDEHSADAGMITRLEAFLDSLRGSRQLGKKDEKVFRPGNMKSAPQNDRVLYFPYMCDAGEAVAAASRSCGIEAYVLPMQDSKDIELGRKHTNSNECFPMICTLGSFLKKLSEPGVDSGKISFFMPDHNGPCRFGQYNRLQRIVFDRLGYQKAQIISPSNDNAYEDVSGGQAQKFRFRAWKGSLAIDLLRKMKQERKPYEYVKGETEKVYQHCLERIVRSIEQGTGDLPVVIKQCVTDFQNVPLVNGKRKPVIAIVGEIFMRDNAFCNGFVIDKLEALGAETIVAPFTEWLIYSTYRYTRDSKWKGDIKGLIKSKIQAYTQNLSARRLLNAAGDAIEHERDIPLKGMLEKCLPYVHKDYDGDPALALGSAAGLYDTGISGVVNLLPFTCMPGTLICSVSHVFRKDHENIPWENIAYDGQDDSGMETRLQAFMHQAEEFSRSKNLDQPRKWKGQLINQYQQYEE
ncbi:MAG: acyl-CoA dehydratase activase, partial [Bacteroidales bacterium]